MDGLDNAAAAFIGMLQGRNFGKLLVQAGEDPTRHFPGRGTLTTVRDFAGKVAVVTGAASGIGRGLAERFAREGMQVVLADVQADALDATVGELQAQHLDVIGVQADVSRLDQVEALRDRALERYGKVHVLCNNAGVAADWGAAIWETTANEWEWTLGVNLYGVIHGVRAFVPLMIAQGEEGHVVNTSSIHGFSTGPGSPTYAASKHAVTRITEGLFYDLAGRDSRVNCSLLCPADVATDLDLAARNRPAAFQDQLPPEREAEIDRLSRHRYDRHQGRGYLPRGGGQCRGRWHPRRTVLPAHPS